MATVGEIQRSERLIHAVSRLADAVGGEVEPRFYRIVVGGGVAWLPVDKVTFIRKDKDSKIHRIFHEGSVDYLPAEAEELDRTYTMAELLAMERSAK